MTVFKQGKLLFLIVRELSTKYTKALALGFVSGLILSLAFWRVLPIIRDQWFTPVDRIALVGEFTPATLPLTIQNELSYGLTTIGRDGTVQPGLATSWTATDSGKTFIFTLRQDARWHDGKPVTAKDINYNIRNVTFSVIDAYTIRAALKAPYSPFPAVVAKPLFASGLIGLGQYKVASLRLNADKVTSVRLTPMTGERVREYFFYKTESDAVLAYKLGQVNRIEDVTSPADIGRWGNATITGEKKYNRIVSLYFNVTTPALADRSIRQALAYASPLREGAERAGSPISKTSWAYSAKTKQYSFDPATAKKLLGNTAEASSGARLTITTFAPYLDDATAISGSWTELGIPTDVKVVSSVPPDYQVLLSAIDVSPDPDQYPFWHSTQKDTNITKYANVKIDKLLEDGRQELDVTKRKSIYADFQRYLTEDAPAVFLYYPTSYTITRN